MSVPPPDSVQGPVPVLFVHFGEDWIRGSERCLLDLFSHIDRARFRPVVWCNTDAMSRAVRELDVPVIKSRFTVLLDWERPRYDIRNAVALVREGARLVRTHGVRLIHANSGAPNQWLIPVARHARIPILAHLHAIYDLRGRCIFGLHHVARVVGVSFETIHGLHDDGVPPRRARVVHNGIDVKRLARGDATYLRNDLGISPDAVVVAGAGSLIARKGFHVLLHAFALVHAQRPETHLIVIGEGPERSRLDALARELGIAHVVHLLGERNDVGAIFRDVAQIGVSASFEEAFGLAVMEAAAMGLPVVATRVAGTAEVIQNGVTGLIVPVEDAAGLADGILRLVADPELRRRFGDAGRALIESDYSIRKNVHALTSIYDTLLARPASDFGWTAPWGTFRPWARLASLTLRRKLGADPSVDGKDARATP